MDFAYRGAKLGFDLSHALFSSFAIDTGTRLLLKEIAHDETVSEAKSILDAGCGVGIIGISLAASCPKAKVVMRDRDIMACAFSERNCWRNGIPARRLDLDGKPAAAIAKRPPKHKENAERQNETIIAPGLLGEDDPFGPYDLVVSNVPAKAGPVILSSFIDACSKKLLNPGGKLAFVIVNTLAELADDWCAASGMSLVKKTAAKSHTVFLLEKPVASATTSDSAADNLPVDGSIADRSLLSFTRREGSLLQYRRSSAQRRLGRYSIPARGFWGLPEFDTTSFATELAIEALEKACAGNLVRDFLVMEPGIGLSALWARRTLGPAKIHALSHDLLALLATAANLEALDSPHPEYIPIQSIEPDSAPDASFDTVLCFPEEIPEYDAIGPTWEFLGRTTKIGAAIVIVSTSTIIARFDKIRPSAMQRIGEKKKKGFSALLVRRSN